MIMQYLPGLFQPLPFFSLNNSLGEVYGLLIPSLTSPENGSKDRSGCWSSLVPAPMQPSKQPSIPKGCLWPLALNGCVWGGRGQGTAAGGCPAPTPAPHPPGGELSGSQWLGLDSKLAAAFPA